MSEIDLKTLTNKCIEQLRQEYFKLREEDKNKEEAIKTLMGKHINDDIPFSWILKAIPEG